MVIETFLHGASPVYARFADKGRMLPDGLHYIDSWLSADGTTCYQLMQTEVPELFDRWTAAWSDLVTFQIVELGAKPIKETDHVDPHHGDDDHGRRGRNDP